MKDRKFPEAIAHLRQLAQVNIQNRWHYCRERLEIDRVNRTEFWDSWDTWPIAPLNEKGHIAWSGKREVIWLTQRLMIPVDLHGYPLAGFTLRLALLWWADDAQIFSNGRSLGHGDLFDCNVRLLLSSAVLPGEEINLALRLVSPAHDPGALVRSHLIYEPVDPAEIDPGFVADEMTILLNYINTYAVDSPETLARFANELHGIDWSAIGDREMFNRSLGFVRDNLRSLLSDLPNIPDKIVLLGHAHLDMAWLWPISETWSVAQNTFESVLNLMGEFPELTFCHSTAALYEWIEINRPDLFRAIQQQVQAGRWEIVAGLWVEPELNIISGESIVRQLLYGQRYCLEKFGQFAPVAWLPDSFGFCWQLPQLFKQARIEYFVTQKLRWNDTTEFPYGVFWWESPDGSRMFSVMSAAIGKGIEPVEMADYANDWQQQTGLSQSLWLPGVGDRGGGPTRDMLEVARKWQKSPFLPQLDYTTAEQYLEALSRKLFKTDLPIWRDELYLEYHRGCYTTYGKQKQWNRRCETLLYQAELFGTLANIIADRPYPKQELEAAWKQVLFNQFHDILPGSSIPEVYDDANQVWQDAQQVATKILDTALNAIAHQISLPTPPTSDAKPIVIFNALNWSRSDVVMVNLPDPLLPNQSWHIYDPTGTEVRSQPCDNCLLFYAENIPSIGYGLFWLVPKSSANNHSQEFPDHYILENEAIRAIVDPETGDLSGMFDKINQRDILCGSGNQLQAFRDRGQYWDAWNIDPNYAQHRLNPPTLKSIQWLEHGPIQWRVRVIRQIGRSDFIQDYILQTHSPILNINTIVDWQEPHVMVKAAFPFTIEADLATYEMPCGAIERTTNPQTPAEQAKWEVPALHWADLTQHSEKVSYGVSLLNNCKYGYDAQPNQLRLTLLRGSTWPDPGADFYSHEFTYAIYPHSGSWQSGQTVRRGYELNVPLSVLILEHSTQLHSHKSGKPLSVNGSFLDLSAENLILMAFKPAEDKSEIQQWILRCYECHGQTSTIQLQSDLGLNINGAVNLLEQPTIADNVKRILPWKVTSFRVQ